MKKTVLSIITFVLLFMAASCKNQKENVTPKDLFYDIERIQIDMAYSALKDLYDPAPFEQLKAEVMEGKVSRLDCVFRIQEILNEYNCVHLQLQLNDKKDLFYKIIPFYFYCFGDDYHVYYASSKYQKYRGWKLVSIDDKSVEEVRNIIKNFTPWETKTGEKYCLENTQSYYYYVAGGLTQKNGKIKFTFESPEGKTETVKCSPMVQNRFSYFLRLSPGKQNQDFIHYNWNHNYGIKTNTEKKTIYVQYNSCFEEDNYRIRQWFSDLMTAVKTEAYDTIVFDLRYNSGGRTDVQILLNSLLYQNKAELEKCNLAIIAGGRTYSCACRFINDFLRNFPEVRIFGEETGQAVFNYTGVHFNNNLKKLNCSFSFPHQIEDTPELDKRALNVTHSDIHQGTIPDVEVKESFEAFMKGEDSIYNAIYDYFLK